MMTIETEVIARMRVLSPERRRDVLEFVTSLAKQRPPATRRNAYGVLAHLGIDLGEDDLAELRREVWRSFPRSAS